MPDVGRSHTVAEFQGGRADQQIRERDPDTSRLVLSVDLSGTKRDSNRHRLDGDTGQ